MKNNVTVLGSGAWGTAVATLLAHNGIDVLLWCYEPEVADAVNKTGIGPQGYGGTVTALDVHIKMMPCHIASLPVAVNIQCHASRHGEVVI